MEINSEQNKYPEIDLKDLINRLWLNKFIIFISILLCLYISIYILINTKKVFTAKSSFFIEQTTPTGGMLSNISPNLKLLEGLYKEGSSSTDQLVREIRGREFVLELAKELQLEKDKFFNDFDPSARIRGWKDKLKDLVGYKSNSIEPINQINWNMLNAFDKNVSIEATEVGTIEITVKHWDPVKAAVIANYIIDKSINRVKQENIRDSKERLRYLSSSLADASQDFEKSQKAIKQFALNNSAQALQSFSTGSILLDNYRAKRNANAEQMRAIEALKSAVQSGNTSSKSYYSLRRDYPVLDQPEFRRIVGLSEIVSAWTWPTISILSQVQKSMRDRIAALDNEIRKVEKEASKYAESAEEYARLTRNLKISEATQTVLIEQVKRQSLAAGFTPDKSKIVSYAEVPIYYTTPNKKLVVGLGVFIGLLLGSGVALFISFIRGSFYSNQALLDFAKPDYDHKIKSLLRYRGASFRSVSAKRVNEIQEWPKQIILETHADASFPLLISVDTTNKKISSTIARIVAASAVHLGYSFALVNLSRKNKNLASLEFKEHELSILEREDHFTEYVFNKSSNNIDWLFSKNFKKSLEYLTEKYDFVGLSVDLADIEMLRSSPNFGEASLVVFAKRGKTKADVLARLQRGKKIKVLLHE